MHSARGFESIVASEELFFEESGFDIVFSDDLKADTFDKFDSFINGKDWRDRVKVFVDVVWGLELVNVLFFLRVGIIKFEASSCPVDSGLHDTICKSCK